MDNKTITLESGATLVVAPAPFGDAMALKNAIFSELKKTGVDLKTLDFKQNVTPELINSLTKTVLTIDSSSKVSEALYKCASRCLYNDRQVNTELFKNTDYWEDYYPIMIEVMKVNLTPFFKGLLSSFGKKVSV